MCPPARHVPDKCRPAAHVPAQLGIILVGFASFLEGGDPAHASTAWQAVGGMLMVTLAEVVQAAQVRRGSAWLGACCRWVHAAPGARQHTLCPADTLSRMAPVLLLQVCAEDMLMSQLSLPPLTVVG